MITITKKVKITKDNKKIEFDLGNLPEGEYTVRLQIETVNKTIEKPDFRSWTSDLNIPPDLTF